jgi:AmmeMemoRadiSam system protein B
MKHKRTLLFLLLGAFTLTGVIGAVRADDDPLFTQSTWANWKKRWDDIYDHIAARHLPGRAMGIVGPSDSRVDILPMTAFGYNVFTKGTFDTVVILMPAPPEIQNSGLTVPGVDTLDTSFGRFVIASSLRDRLASASQQVFVDPNLFQQEIPLMLQRQLSALKYVLQKDSTRLNILPVYVRFTDVNTQVKDLAPFLVDRVREMNADDDIAFVIVSDLTHTNSEEKLISSDGLLLRAIREMDVERMIGVNFSSSNVDMKWPDQSALALGTLTLRLMGADHGDILAYSHSGQLILTKDKRSPHGYVAAGFASRPVVQNHVPHVNRDQMLDTFGELLRSDMLALVRQTCLSTLDATAAKPPSINSPQAAKKWPVYISVFDPQGKLAGQAGSHLATGPLEESLRKYTFEAVRRAQPDINKSNAASFVLEIAIPYGFERVEFPDDLVPLLNGVVVQQRLKTQALPPEGWRQYPDPHQLLSAISTRLGSEPWTYATTLSSLDSFRTFAFNEKEPFQDLGGGKKKKKKSGDDIDDAGAGGGGGGGGSFGF